MRHRPGCLCEGWGVADALSRVTGYADEAAGGVVNINVLDFQATRSTAVSHVQIGNTFEVTHDYHPSTSPNLYEVTVTIKNISGAPTDVRYRRAMDWDVEPTPFDEFVTVVTIEGTERAANVLFSSDNGFAVPNPLAGPSSIRFIGDTVDSGPDDHGALFDFGFGIVQPKSVQFKSTARRGNRAGGRQGPGRSSGGSLFTVSPVLRRPNPGDPNTFTLLFAPSAVTLFVADRDEDGVRMSSTIVPEFPIRPGGRI
jgi:hypothetical protein